MEKITVVIVDDHKLIREMWSKMLAVKSESDSYQIEVTGESGKFDDAIEIIKAKRPDIVLLDINLSDASGFDAVPLIRKYSPGTRIIVVSMHSRPAYARKMFHLGAKAYITKNSSKEEVFKAIEEVMNGRIYICAEIKDTLVDHVLQSDLDGSPVKDLTIREIEIIKEIKKGLSSKEISSILDITVRTVEVHRYNILKKLKLKNSPALINFINNTDLNFQ
jgi:DNA-binding NarL/FixJ family response regulator